MPFGIGPGELILLAVIALLLFGPKKLPEIGKSIGESLGAFKRAMNAIAEPEPEPPALPVPAPSTPSPASAVTATPEQQSPAPATPSATPAPPVSSQELPENDSAKS